MSGDAEEGGLESGPVTTLGRFELIDHRSSAPLFADEPGGERVPLFAREVRRRGGQRMPWLVYLQGGPGFESPRPENDDGWIGTATKRFRVLLVDQRGTGNSGAIEGGRVPAARVFAAHRADAIVADCEHWRALLANDEPWSVLGQSFGGFCAVHYLSRCPSALERVLVTGGLPPFAPIEEVYARTFAKMRAKSLAHYERFDGDAERVDRIARRLTEDDVRLPCGDRLTVPRFQQVGMALGRARGGAALHWLFESAFARGDDGPLTQRFLAAVERSQGYPTNPLYAVLHESIYAEGRATSWAADRVRAEAGEHEWRAGEPLTLTGESVHPWMFDEYGALAPYADVANELAAKDDWPALYDKDALARNEVPIAAAVYTHDLFVDRELSLATAKAIRGTDVFESAKHEHDGLREDGPAILGELLSRTDRASADRSRSGRGGNGRAGNGRTGDGRSGRDARRADSRSGRGA